jgi:hypothetical protein
MIIHRRSTIPLLLLLAVSCHERPRNNKSNFLPPDAKMVQTDLTDSLGKVALAVPARYDTAFSWINHSDCGKPCDVQEYRYQPKLLPIKKESGFFSLGEPKDSVDQLTISHSSDNQYNRVDSAKDPRTLQYAKLQLAQNPMNPPIIFDTIEKIGDRYFSIIAMERSDTIQHKEVLAITTIKGNKIKFQYDLLTKKSDSITKDFIKNSIDLIRTIQITNGR